MFCKRLGGGYLGLPKTARERAAVSSPVKDRDYVRISPVGIGLQQDHFRKSDRNGFQ